MHPFNLYYSAAECPAPVPENSLIKADCLDVLGKIADKSVDMIFADLPYGTTACAWDSVIPLNDYVFIGKGFMYWEDFAMLAFEKGVSYECALKCFNEHKKTGVFTHFFRIAKESAPIILTGSQPFTTEIVNAARRYFRFEWIWDKVAGANFANLKNQPLKVHENVLIFSQQPIKKFNRILEPRTESSLERFPVGGKICVLKPKKNSLPAEHYSGGISRHEHSLRDDGLKHPTSIRTIARRQKGVFKYKHPTKKPVALVKYFIETYTDPDALVFDPCLGSGTTAVACIQTGRRCIGIEMGDYFDTHCVPRTFEAAQQESQKLF